MRITLLLSTIGLSLGLVACGGSGASPAQAKAPIDHVIVIF